MAKMEFKKRILFIGVPDMAYIGLDSLLFSGVNIVGVLGPYKTHNTYQYFKNFVKMRRLNFIEYDTISSPELIEEIKELNVDLAVVCSFNNKIPKEFISAIKDGILNIHPSLLPKYRGGNPYSRVIMNGETNTGVTIHFMSEKFDEGNIVKQEACPIDENETMGTLFHKTNYIGCKLLLSALIEYENTGVLNSIPQENGEFPKANNIKDEETFINFNKSAKEIELLTRALNPYICAKTIFNREVLRIHKVVSTHEIAPQEYSNGQIYKITDKDIYIKTSNGTINPKVLQYSGYFTGDIEDFIKIVKPKVGDKFGNG
jgi:methionyl-tRNA formyltransferase